VLQVPVATPAPSVLLSKSAHLHAAWVTLSQTKGIWRAVVVIDAFSGLRAPRRPPSRLIKDDHHQRSHASRRITTPAPEDCGSSVGPALVPPRYSRLLGLLTR
jgi:hypothetical protein